MTENLFSELLKKYTDIEHKFIDTFFSKFEIGNELIFNLEDKKVAKYLKIELKTMRERLRNRFAKVPIYHRGVDYQIITDKKDKRKKTYLLNYEAFEKLAMATDTLQGSLVRNYFVKLRKFIYENKSIINQSLNDKEKLNKLINRHVIYFFVADPKYPDILKLGRTIDIISRLRAYNTGRIYEPELKYLAVVENSFLIESCVKLMLDKNRVYKNTELFKISADNMIEAIDKCYKKLTNQEANAKLYEEVSELLKMYYYVQKVSLSEKIVNYLKILCQYYFQIFGVKLYKTNLKNNY